MEIEQGDIIVASSTDKDMMNIINKASAIITEEGGLTSHAAVVGVSLGIPIIVSATNALKLIEDNETITIDAQSGLVYKGEVRML